MKTVIIGAGLSGLSLAYHLEKQGDRDYIILESSSEVGGLSKSIRKEGFIFDFAIHMLHLRNEEIITLIKELLGEKLILKDRNAGIFLNERVIPYPFQYNNYFLDKETKIECLKGIIDSAKKFSENKIPKNFKEWMENSQGKGIADSFMTPYNKKCYAISPEELTIDCGGRFLPKPEFEEIIQGADRDISKIKVGYNYQFYYPKGGISELSEAFAQKIQNICLGERAIKIDINRRLIITNRNVYYFDNLISTIPLKDFIRLIEDVPEKIKIANEKLRYNKVSAVLLGINHPNICPYQWLYIPQEEILSYRLSFPMNYSEKMAPPNMSAICAEYSYIGERKLSDMELIDRTINDLIKMELIKKKEEVIFEKIVDLNPGYVLFDFDRNENLQIIQDYLKENNIYSIGRYGAWEYSSMEDAIIYGKDMASKLTEKDLNVQNKSPV